VRSEEQDVLLRLAARGRGPRRLGFSHAPMLRALRRAGTRRIYAHSADFEEIGRAIETDEGIVLEEVDGNTADQPIVRKVLDRYLDFANVRLWAEPLTASSLWTGEDRLRWAYVLLLGQIAHDMAVRFGVGHDWDTNLQVPMGVCADPDRAVETARVIAKTAPGAVVQIPFTPQRHEVLLVARRLEREAIPVNLTSTFSARQAATAALLPEVTRTSLFAGRLDRGLPARGLGPHVALEAQRSVCRARRAVGAKTLLVVAGVRDWRTLVDAAGCDAWTVSPTVLGEFLAQDEADPGDVESRLDVPTLEEIDVGAGARDALGDDGLADLWRVPRAYLAFLRDYRDSGRFEEARDGEDVHRAFDEAGFGDLFHDPSEKERRTLREGALPDLAGPLTGRIALDTLFALHAHADHERHQETIDRRIRESLDEARSES